ncbi:MAG: magnesium and cobalt exporter, family [Hyphomicrobiales bacterium]|jgi:putative hemolysin
MLLELAIIFALIIVNGLLAMSELAIVSSRPARLKVLIARGVTGSHRALKLASDPGRFLSTVQTGITLVGIIAGAYSGATLGRRLADWLVGQGLGAHIAEYLGFGLVVTLITYFSLILGELVPKQLALRNPERIACMVAPAMMWLARIGAPFAWALDASGKVVLRLFGGGDAAGGVTEEEIHTVVAEAEGAGVLQPQERAMISAVLRLGDRSVNAVMTPRHDVDVIDIGEDPQAIRRKVAASHHTRLPVYDADVDGMIGVIQAKDLLADPNCSQNDIRQMVRAAPVVPDSMDALDVVGLFREMSVSIGLVHDEYGQFLGVVTPADILESIVGEFKDEGEPDMVLRPDGSYLVSGAMPADNLAERLGIPLDPDRSFHTAAGLVLAKFGHIPEIGECDEIHGWRFEVVDLDGRRIDKLLVSRIAPTHRMRVA